MQEMEAWALERRFWLDGADFHAAVLDPACLMAFPGVGLMRAADILQSLGSAPRWVAVEMTERAIGYAGDGVLVLGYCAEARREGAAPYRCLCTSTYRRDGEAWRLVQHQQSPLG